MSDAPIRYNSVDVALMSDAPIRRCRSEVRNTKTKQYKTNLSRTPTCALVVFVCIVTRTLRVHTRIVCCVYLFVVIPQRIML